MMSESKARKPLRLGWLSTGRGSGSRALLDSAHKAIVDGSLNATIECVFCTRERGEAEGSDEFLDQAEGSGLRTASLSYRSFKKRYSTDSNWRRHYDEKLLDLITDFDVDALVFAGLLLVVANDIVEKIPSLNLHPAAPNGPVGTWQEVIAKLIEDNANETGISVQLATQELDKGPVVAFSRFPIPGLDYWHPQQAAIDWSSIFSQAEQLVARGGVSLSTEEPKPYGYSFAHRQTPTTVSPESDPLFAMIRQEGLRREALTLVAALRQIADGNVSIDDGVVKDASGEPLAGGIDITQEIEAAIAANPEPENA